MARHASAYRQARRAAYWSNAQIYNVISWREYNDTRAYEEYEKPPNLYGAGSPELTPASSIGDRSKAKEDKQNG